MKVGVEDCGQCCEASWLNFSREVTAMDNGRCKELRSRLLFNEKRGEGRVVVNEKRLDCRRLKKEERLC